MHVETLNLSACSSIKSFSCRTASLQLLITLLPLIGKTLESLRIACDSDEQNYGELLEVIQENCKHLTIIEFSNDVVCYVGEHR